MGILKRGFVDRAPRFVLRGKDDQLLKLSGDQSSIEAAPSRIVNISETGLNFILSHNGASELSEMIGEEIERRETADQDRPLAHG